VEGWDVRRSVLLSISVLGILICLVGGSGLFAALSDTARTGTNTATSNALNGSADLQLATGNFVPGAGVVCGTFEDNLSSGLINESNMEPGDGSSRIFCIRNQGSQTLDLSVLIENRTDVDTDCTGDEADSGDATCGAGQTGELSSVLFIAFGETPCAADPPIPSTVASAPLSTNSAIPMGTIGAGSTRCLSAQIDYPSTTLGPFVQRAQSDSVTWIYAFTGSV
jgi:hypothetical protein